MDGGTTAESRSVLHARFETRLREMTVTEVERVTPHMIRVTLTGDLTGFQSLGFDDHIKLFFADPDTGILTLPVLNAVAPAGGPRPLMRDYTPRRFDVKTGMMGIDFAIHEAGPATQWALRARTGDALNIGGPRGSRIIPPAFDSYLLIGDDTALPAIGRRLEELPPLTPVTVLCEVDHPDDRLTFDTQADATIHWVYRHASHGARTLNDALKALWVPQNDLYAWVACEASQARLIREQLIDDHGVNPKWLKVSGYWHRGSAGLHEKIDG